MFCGWGHYPWCKCETCYILNNLSRKAAYRIALRRAKAASKEVSDMALRKPMPGELYGQPSVEFTDVAFREDYPNLSDYLFTDRWTDGSVRVTSTISLFSDGRALKLVLNDKENNRSAFFCEATLAEAFRAVEVALANDRVDWKSRSTGPSKGMATPF